jgi:O-antigen/teichoic acid export membrane protein
VKKGFLALLASLTARVGASMLLFILLAREWGAERFGEFMYLFSVAAILVLVCEFGFTQQILRDVGRNPETAAQQMGAFLGAKIWLTFSALVLLLTFLWFSSLSMESGALLLLLFAAAVLLSYSDFLFACYRALGRYEWETVITVQGNLVYFAAGVGVLYWTGSAVQVACTLMGARAFQLLLAAKRFGRLLPETIRPDLNARSAGGVIRRSLPFGAEVATAAIYVNADTLLVTHVLGYAANGVYQAAARFYQGACQLPPIFSSLFLPRMARDQTNAAAFSVHVNKLYIVMILAGLLCMAAFFVLPYFIPYIYTDPSLEEASKLLPWFGLLLCIRFIAAAQGISLTVLNGQTTRVLLLLMTMIVMLATAIPLLRSVGVSGMVIACIIAHVLLSCSFWYWTEARGVMARKLLLTAHIGFLSVAIAFYFFNF